jgi:Cysteine dioxygenase type I
MTPQRTPVGRPRAEVDIRTLGLFTTGAPGRGDLEATAEEAWLLTLARRFAEQTPLARLDHLERSYQLLEHNEHFEVWAIHWPTGGHLELHDHGDAAGAFWVLSGYLEECTVSPSGLVNCRRVGAHRGRAFGCGLVHDIVNPGSRPATSVHVYSPPLASMTFFRWAGDQLVPDRTEYRSDTTWAP